MTTTTGFYDDFGRTVSGTFGVADSGQQYIIAVPGTQYTVGSGKANIAVSSAGNMYGRADLRSQDVDITGVVSMSAIPATNLATVGFMSKFSSTANYYNGTMMVATGGAISLRFSKVVSSSLSTISTVSTGLTYVANATYNLRYQCFWSPGLQTNVMRLKLWATGGTEPGGWMSTSFDASISPYIAGTYIGLMARDESTVLGTITTTHRSVSAQSYNLPMPSSADPMCAAVGATNESDLCSLSLADGTFETADGAWTNLGHCSFTRQSAVVNNGLYAGQVTASGAAATQMTARIANTLTPAVTAGTLYYLSGYIRSATAYPAASLAIDWLDSSKNYLSTDSTPVSLLANTWTQVVVEANAPVGAAYASYGPTVSTPADGTSLYFDDIDFQAFCETTAPVYPSETVVQQLADATDKVVAALSPLSDIAAAFPRVRVSTTGTTWATTTGFLTGTFNTVEFNVGTTTNLSYDATRLFLPTGVWLITFEVQLAEATSSYLYGQFYGTTYYGYTEFMMRQNASQSNDEGIGGCLHGSTVCYVPPTSTPGQVGAGMSPASSSVSYTVRYAALSAIKISDYFT